LSEAGRLERAAQETNVPTLHKGEALAMDRVHEAEALLRTSHADGDRKWSGFLLCLRLVGSGIAVEGSLPNARHLVYEAPHG
jgi:hypothetical protein